MLLAGVLQRKLLLEWKTLNETHVMWDFNSLGLGKVKESGPYTLGLFSLVTKNVYAIGFNHFIRSSFHVLDRVNTSHLKLIWKNSAIVLHTTYLRGQRCRRGRRTDVVLFSFLNVFTHQLHICTIVSTTQPCYNFTESTM